MFNKQNRSASSSLIPLDKLEWHAFLGKDSESIMICPARLKTQTFPFVNILPLIPGHSANDTLVRRFAGFLDRL